MQVIIEPLLRKGNVKSIKPSYSPTHGEFENLYFISVAPIALAFVYDAVDVNKIIAISSIKPPSYTYAQVTTGLKLYLG